MILCQRWIDCGQGLELQPASYLEAFSSIAEQLEEINANLEDLGHEISLII